uniref:Uncharacterized protein n=1 Tax=Eutreptiella gymnastica TaxID=73025 RepID=A0A7S1IQ76_9EUGL
MTVADGCTIWGGDFYFGVALWLACWLTKPIAQGCTASTPKFHHKHGCTHTYLGNWGARTIPEKRGEKEIDVTVCICEDMFWCPASCETWYKENPAMCTAPHRA